MYIFKNVLKTQRDDSAKIYRYFREKRLLQYNSYYLFIEISDIGDILMLKYVRNARPYMFILLSISVGVSVALFIGIVIMMKKESVQTKRLLHEFNYVDSDDAAAMRKDIIA